MTSARSANRSACARISLTGDPWLGRGGELLEHYPLIEGVTSLGQALRTGQSIAEGLLVHVRSRVAVSLDTFVADSDELGQLVLAQSKLSRSGPDLLTPGVGLNAVLLSLARGQRRALRGGLRPESDSTRLGRAKHLSRRFEK